MALCTDVAHSPDGRWKAKDHLAHLAWWRSRNAALVEALRLGKEPPPSVNDDEQNAVIYADNRDRPLVEVAAQAAQSWERLSAAIAACSEDDLARPHPYATGFSMAETLSGNGHGHLAQHLMFWYLENGDEPRAEAIQKWVRDVDLAAADSDRRRAIATYNLACFYGRVARAGDALPLLRESFAGAPDLVTFAARDPDLDPIRTDERLVELLAT